MFPLVDGRFDRVELDFHQVSMHVICICVKPARRPSPRCLLHAIVVTGSSLGGHEQEAEAHDFHPLVKSVPPNKLRAMIGFKLGVRST